VPFKDVVAAHGHRRLAELLARSVRRNALPPSLIFSGPPGGAMREMATALAQALNCLAPVDVGESRDACGVCGACSRIARGVHPDVVSVVPDDKGRVNVEHIRDVIDRVGFRPFEGRRRVVIIDEAETMLAPAQSALLKVLEEPPPSSVFVLVTSRPDLLLPTVHSRCPRLRFETTGTGTVDADVREAACSVLMHVSATDDPARRIEAARDLLPTRPGVGRVEREHVATHLRAMASVLRDVELLASRGDSRKLANAEVRPILDRLTKPFGGDRGIRAFAAVDRALEALDRNAGVKIVADWLVLQL
jgi:DNA polymerase III delta subunit-like protein